jgi:hypothetical protein
LVESREIARLWEDLLSHQSFTNHIPSLPHFRLDLVLTLWGNSENSESEWIAGFLFFFKCRKMTVKDRRGRGNLWARLSARLTEIELLHELEFWKLHPQKLPAPTCPWKAQCTL